VRYAVERRVAAGQPDYWDYATLLELSVLGNDQGGAATALSDALAHTREPFELETTARNLRLIREAREGRGEAASWIHEVEVALGGTGSS
jgi:MAP3K TRAFs-binding domain